MADKKISELTSLTSVDFSENSDQLPIVDSSLGITKRITAKTLMESKSFITVGGAFVGGNQAGNTRGSGALDIQAARDGDARVAGGELSIAIGSDCLASADKSYAIGRQNFVQATNSVAVGEQIDIKSTATESVVFGRDCQISGDRSVVLGQIVKVSSDSDRSVAIGRSVTVNDNADASTSVGNMIKQSGHFTVAMGLHLHVSGNNSSAFGRYVRVNTHAVTELGSWYGNGNRGTSVRLCNLGDSDNPTGTTAFSLANKSFSQIDGGTVAGSELLDALPREMISIRRNSDEILADVNIGGTVKTVSFGQATRVGNDDAEASRTSIGSAVQNVRADTVTVNSIRQMDQATYDGLVSTSAVDANTVYIIVG